MPLLVLHVLTAPVLGLMPSSMKLVVAGDREKLDLVLLRVVGRRERIAWECCNSRFEVVEIEWWFHVFLKMREVNDSILD